MQYLGSAAENHMVDSKTSSSYHLYSKFIKDPTLQQRLIDECAPDLFQYQENVRLSFLSDSILAGEQYNISAQRLVPHVSRYGP